MLKVANVTKSYNGRPAVDGVSLEVQAGEVFGLLGPNGAGKSTTIAMICGLLRPDSGEITVDGHPIRSRSLEARRILGVIPQDIALYPTLTAAENLRFWGRMYGLKYPLLSQRVAEALQVVGLSARGRERVETYSGGMKRRVNIAAGLLHRPKLLLMDEPTVGIDPQSRRHILETVKELNRGGMTILYTSHYMEEVEYLCHRVGIIDEGRLRALGTKNELRLLVGDKDIIQVKLSGQAAEALSTVKGLDGVEGVSAEGNRLTVLSSMGRRALPGVIAALAGAGRKVESVEIKEPDLEGVFLHLTGKALRD